MPKKQLHLFLVPAPGAKPEFLATLESDSKHWNDHELPPKVTLEGYTRDSWAWKPAPEIWRQAKSKSVDGRNKLVGFVKYLKDRKKCAYGRYSPTSVFVVTYQEQDGASAEALTCRFTNSMSQIPDIPFGKAKSKPQPAPAKSKPPVPTVVATNARSSSSAPKKKSGMLGNLLGAQKRTNVHLHNAPTKAKPLAVVKGGAGGAAPAGVAEGGGEARTAPQVFSDFRSEMEQKMLDFDIAENETELKIKISLAEITRGLDEEAKTRVNIETLKFMVIEQAEEVNEEWVANQEPSEFMDEATMIVYKEGHAPEDVLEEMNRVELTEDMRGQARALQDARRREEERKERQIDLANRAALQADDEDVAALNTKKRDRRTIEEIQRGFGGEELPNNKMAKM
uniref:Uncharacterized protein n=1 Tax=Grammatophora oceanica TaxID=210454 RepID=A0A7S1VE35_9STRA|mmetsp:Transcript_44224/g.65593  ORF Transcript_44224/g.65593 Transcript_44224/m.65593 type:complete len:396 (+) Transcript_44224:70-1257(+)